MMWQQGEVCANTVAISTIFSSLGALQEKKDCQT
jgi:hypothetical protein